MKLKIFNIFNRQRPLSMAVMQGFDRAFYLESNPDVRLSGQDPLQHYQHLGWKEGRDPSAHFSTTGYLRENPDVAEAGLNPLLHFSMFGVAEGRKGYAAKSNAVAERRDNADDVIRPQSLPKSFNSNPPQGYIDQADHFFVRGWALNSEITNARSEIEISVNGQVAAIVRADKYRADLRQLNLEDCTYGFEYEFSTPLNRETNNVIIVRIIPDNVEIGRSVLDVYASKFENWTSTIGTRADQASVPKIIQHKGIFYYSCSINRPDDLSPRNSMYIYPAIQQRIERDRALIDKTRKDIDPFTHIGAIENVTFEKSSDTTPFWNNGYFSYADARAAVGLTAAYRPAKILEVGSGNSTKFFRLAVDAYSPATEIISIDPNPREEISTICNTTLRKSVFDLDISIFQSLNSGDFLFWDGSHVVGNGADASRLFLEVIPVLKKGVFVHVHDVSLPYEAFECKEYGDYSFPEQYLLGSFLVANTSCEVLLPNYYLFRNCVDGGGSSFWFINR